MSKGICILFILVENEFCSLLEVTEPRGAAMNLNTVDLKEPFKNHLKQLYSE
jgi:hypothetical protein